MLLFYNSQQHMGIFKSKRGSYHDSILFSRCSYRFNSSPDIVFLFSTVFRTSRLRFKGLKPKSLAYGPKRRKYYSVCTVKHAV